MANSANFLAQSGGEIHEIARNGKKSSQVSSENRKVPSLAVGFDFAPAPARPERQRQRVGGKGTGPAQADSSLSRFARASE
jgi:hypothetical protein